MMFDEKSRKGPSSTLISKPPVKSTTTKPKSKADIIEPEIDIESVPILQGSFEVTKTDADITEKKVRTSTLKPFTITNGAVRMKPKKTTIEKVKPVKIPESLTGNVLKLENVTKSYHNERVTTLTTRAPTTTEEESPTTTMETVIQSSSETSTTKPLFPTLSSISLSSMSTLSTSLLMQDDTSSSSSATTTERSIPSIPSVVVFPSEPPSNNPIDDLTSLKGEIITQQVNKKNQSYPSTIVLDNQPWLPIQPNTKPVDLNEAKKKIHNSYSPPAIAPNYNTDPQLLDVNYNPQLLPRNKIRTPVSGMVQKTARPTVYQGFNNQALMYGMHEVERLGGSYVKPFPLPVDLIGDQLTKKDDALFLNKGEVLPSIKESRPDVTTMKVTTIKVTTTPAYEKVSDSNTEASITLNIEETTIRTKLNKTQSGAEDDPSDQQVGEILLDLLKESNVKLNDSAEDLAAQSRIDELDLPEQKLPEARPEVQNQTEKTLLTDEIDHTEALDEIATVLSSMETLSFKNIKDYIMATTKSISKEILSTSTESDETTPRRDKPENVIDPMVKLDRIGSIAETTPIIVPRDRTRPTTTTASASVRVSTTPPNPFSNQDTITDSVTTSYVEVETVQYTPGSSWNAGLFPLQSKWEIVNGSIVYPSVAPMRKVFNDTLQAWIIENPMEATERLPPTLIRNSSEPLKNISTIFDTLASKLSIETMDNEKLPPFMPHFTSKHKNDPHSSPPDFVTSPTVMKKPQPTTTAPAASTSASMGEELPVLLNQNTESYYASSAETLIGQAEIEVVDPTQYEQMLLIDRVSSALRPTSTIPSLVTLMPVKSNSGIRQNFSNDKMKGSGRGFSPAAQSSTSNRRRFEDASFVVRTSMNISP